MHSRFQSLKAFTVWLLWFRKFSPKPTIFPWFSQTQRVLSANFLFSTHPVPQKAWGKTVVPVMVMKPSILAVDLRKICQQLRSIFFTVQPDLLTPILNAPCSLRREHDLISTNWGSQFYSLIELTSSINFQVTLWPSIKISINLELSNIVLASIKISWMSLANACPRILHPKLLLLSLCLFFPIPN